jgi:hypothetical protein
MLKRQLQVQEQTKLGHTYRPDNETREWGPTLLASGTRGNGVFLIEAEVVVSAAYG